MNQLLQSEQNKHSDESILERGSLDDKQVKALVRHIASLALHPVWQESMRSIISPILERIEALEKNFINGIREIKSSEKLNELELEIIKANEKNKDLTNKVRRLEAELRNRNMSSDKVDATELRDRNMSSDKVDVSNETAETAETSMPIARTFLSTAKGIRGATKEALLRLRSRENQSQDSRKHFFIEELKRLLPSTRGEIYSTKADNLIFIRSGTDATLSGSPAWFITVNAASPNPVGVFLWTIFDSDGDSLGAKELKYMDLDVLEPAIIPADVEFQAADPYIRGEYASIERIIKGKIL